MKNSVVFMCAVLLVVAYSTSAQSLLGSSAYTPGVLPDWTDVINPQLKLVATSGHIRVPHKSADASISAVFSFEANKNVYWGETADNGTYFFRGRNVSFERNMTLAGTFSVGNGISLDRPTWPYILFSENGVQSARIQGTGGMFAVTSTNGASNWLTVNSTSGNVGVGTSPFSFRMTVAGASQAEESVINISNLIDQDLHVRLSAVGAATKRTIISPSTTGRLSLGVAFGEYLTVTSNGNVGIGSVNPNQKLTVNGTIYGKEVKVDLSVPGPDYVFLNTYSLRSLAEVEDYIKANQHLPEVPSASQMEKEGINLSEMNMLLLKKVEELTLYVIQLRKDLDAVKGEKNKN